MNSRARRRSGREHGDEAAPPPAPGPGTASGRSRARIRARPRPGPRRERRRGGGSRAPPAGRDRLLHRPDGRLERLRDRPAAGPPPPDRPRPPRHRSAWRTLRIGGRGPREATFASCRAPVSVTAARFRRKAYSVAEKPWLRLPPAARRPGTRCRRAPCAATAAAARSSACSRSELWASGGGVLEDRGTARASRRCRAPRPEASALVAAPRRPRAGLPGHEERGSRLQAARVLQGAGDLRRAGGGDRRIDPEAGAGPARKLGGSRGERQAEQGARRGRRRWAESMAASITALPPAGNSPRNPC